jgi:hypothetical protein
MTFSKYYLSLTLLLSFIPIPALADGGVPMLLFVTFPLIVLALLPGMKEN